VTRSEIDALVSRVLRDVLKRRSARQVFLFGAAGEPFWCAEHPIRPDDLMLLEHALGLIQTVEAYRPKPFIDHDPRGLFTIAALGEDSDLYVVVMNSLPDRIAAEARVDLVRADLNGELRALRSRPLRVGAGYLC